LLTRAPWQEATPLGSVGIEGARIVGNLDLTDTSVIRAIQIDGSRIGGKIDLRGMRTDSLIELGRDADLLVSEAYVYDKPVPMHLAYRQLVEKLLLIRPKRLIITHMSDDMLGRGDAVAHETAQDGMIVKI